MATWMASSKPTYAPMSATTNPPPHRAYRKRMKALSFILLLLFNTACIPLIDYENTQEDTRTALVYLDDTHQAQQTLILRRVPVESITLWIAHPADNSPSAQSLTLTLEGTDERGPQVVRQTYGLAHTPQPAALPFQLPEANFVPGQTVTLTLQAHGGGLWLYGRGENAYPQGSLNLDGTHQQGDLAFRLTYDYNLRALGEDLSHTLPQAWLLLPLLGLFLLPGWVLTSNKSPMVIIPLSAAFWPLLLAWTSPLGLHWTRPTLLGFTAFLLGLSTWQAYPIIRWHHANLRRLCRRLCLPVGVFLLVLAARLIMVRDLAVSPWVDSVHHALITRLIVDQGAYPSTYFPYAQTANAHYHSGFHALVAVFHWLSGLVIPQAMRLLGQVLNALVSVLAVYTFSRTLGFSKRAGLFAALIAGLFTPMPAYYLSWGRYTQLAGLLLLPTAFALWVAKEPETGGKRLKHPSSTTWIAKTLPLSVLLAGLTITHYRVAAFLALLILAWEFTHLRENTLRRVMHRLMAGLLAFGLALPWLWPTFLNFVIPKTVVWSNNPKRTPWFVDFTWQYLSAGLGRYTLILAALGLLWALWKHSRTALTLLLWVGSLFLLANLGALGLPGRTWVNNTSVEITLFLPVAVLGGLFLDVLLRGLAKVPSIVLLWENYADREDFITRYRLWLRDEFRVTVGKIRTWRTRGAGESLGQENPSTRVPPESPVWLFLGRFLGGILLGVAIFHGLRATLPLVNPITVLYHQSDTAALEWIDTHLPADALVIINPAPWGYGLYVGADGGYWISPATGRRTFPPTLLYGWGQSEEIHTVNAQSQKLLEVADDPNALADFMETLGADYVYLGARGGPFSASTLQASDLFQVSYHQGDCWVFQLGSPFHQTP